MKIYALNGGPRKNRNTDKMLKSFISGVQSVEKNAEVEIIYLFDYVYKGCQSCFLCKKKQGDTYGKCCYPDVMKDILEDMGKSDGIVCATPIYFHNISGQLRIFLERLFFQYHSFEKDETSIAPKKIYSAMIYTMNVTREQMQYSDYRRNLSLTEHYFEYTFHSYPDVIYAFNTLLMEDYSHHELSIWNVDYKKAYQKQYFKEDLQSAFESGVKMAMKIKEDNYENLCD